MAYKIKKSILAGTSGHRKAVTDRSASLIKINRSIDKSSKDDGRAKSSAFQKVSEEDAKKLAETKAETNKKNNTNTNTKITTERGEKDGVKGQWRHTDTTTAGGGVGSAEYNEAFRKAKNAGLKTFTFKGKEHEVKLADSSTNRESEFRPDMEPLSIRPIVPVPTIPEDNPGPVGINTGYCIDKATGKEISAQLTPSQMRRKPFGQRILQRAQSMLPDACKRGSTTTKYCNGMTRDQINAEKEKCRKMGNIVSKTFKERHYFSMKTCQCEKTSSSSGELIEKAGDKLKDIDLSKCIPKFDKKGNIISECGGSDGGGPRGGGRTM